MLRINCLTGCHNRGLINMPGIFEQSFNTPLPNTDIAGQLVALRMRNEAMKPDGIIKGLSQVGKVFTDAAEEQRAANTALLQRRLDMLNPAQIEQMIAQGIDPVAEAYNADIPINVDDEALNKAWRANIIDAQIAQGNKWVTTVLPTIPHEDKLKLLHGDTSTFIKWGLTDFMRMDPALRTFIADNIKSAADRENERRYYEFRKSTQQYVDEGTVPTSAVGELDSSGDIPQAMKTDADTVIEAADERNKSQASVGNYPSNPWGKNDYTGTRLSTKAARMVDEWIAYHSMNPNNDQNDFIKQYDFGDEPEENKLKVIQEFSAAIRNPDKQGEYTIGQSNVTPREYTGDVTSFAGQEDAIKYIDAQEREGNTTARNIADKKLTTQINQNVEKTYYKQLFTELKNGTTKSELTTLRDSILQKSMQNRSRMSKALYDKYTTAIKDTFDRYIEQAGKNETDHGANIKQWQEQARNRVLNYPHGMYKTKLVKGEPIEFSNKKLIGPLSTLIKNTFFKSVALQNAWDNADDTTKEIFLYEALNHVGLINDLRQLDAEKPEELIKKIKDNRYAKSGITDESFARYLEDINILDVNNSFKSQKLEKEMNASLASGSTK